MFRWVLVGALTLGIAMGACAQDALFRNSLKFETSHMQLSNSKMNDLVDFGRTYTIEKPVFTTSLLQSSLAFSHTGFKATYPTTSASGSLNSMMFNTRVAMPLRNKALCPYVGAGIGVTHRSGGGTDESFNVDSPISAPSIASGQFTWQAMAGLNLGRSLYAELKYINGGHVDSTGLSLGLGTRF